MGARTARRAENLLHIRGKAVVSKSIAIFGTWSQGLTQGTLLLKIDQSPFPNWNATEQHRSASSSRAASSSTDRASLGRRLGHGDLGTCTVTLKSAAPHRLRAA